jgi:plastocyanin
VWHQSRKITALSLAMNLLAVAAVGCTGGTPGIEGTHGAAAGTVASAGGDSRRAEVAKQIVIDNFSFDPATLTVPVGTKVTWVNHDDVPHTATSTAKPKRFESGTLDTDGQFTYVFTSPGTYEYFCAVHPKMTGKIIVK